MERHMLDCPRPQGRGRTPEASASLARNASAQWVQLSEGRTRGAGRLLIATCGVSLLIPRATQGIGAGCRELERWSGSKLAPSHTKSTWAPCKDRQRAESEGPLQER